MRRSRFERFIAKLDGVQMKADGVGFTALCPAHDDHKPSLDVSIDPNGLIDVTCYAGCATDYIGDIVGIDLHGMRMTSGLSKRQKAICGQSVTRRQRGSRESAVYAYVDENGKLLYEVVRLEPKDFRQRRPDGRGGSIWNMKNVQRVLYRLPEVLAASAETWIVVVEGEKDVDNLRRLGFVATTCAGGANKWHLTEQTPLYRRKITIVPDNDPSGRKHAVQVANSLFGKTQAVKVVALPGLPEKGDVSDWLESGNTADELKALIEECPLFDPEAIEDDHSSDELVLDPNDPRTSARAFLGSRFSLNGFPILRFFLGLYHVWGDGKYRQLDDDEMRAKLYEFLEFAMRDRRGALVPFQPKPRNVRDIADALIGLVLLESSAEPPIWLTEKEGQPDSALLLPTRSQLLHVGTREVLEATPSFFCTTALPFDYQDNVDPPHGWLNFLAELWPDDPDSIALLQEWFGYVLTLDTRQQKILLMVGPKRAGKGTIARILTGLLGQENVAGPTLDSLGTNFGLWGLIGKALAIVSDARLSGRSNQARLTERLLSISGEDAVSVDRKFLKPVTVKLSARIMIITNELPWLRDASGALVGRFVVLVLRKSFYGKEDIALTSRLLAELPAILGWALDGRDRLQKRGAFKPPKASDDALREMEELSSPIIAFVSECCLVDEKIEITSGRLYECWRIWCNDCGKSYTGDKASFGKNLHAGYPDIRVVQYREGGRKVRFYKGIGLNPTWQNRREAY